MTFPRIIKVLSKKKNVFERESETLSKNEITNFCPSKHSVALDMCPTRFDGSVRHSRPGFSRGSLGRSNACAMKNFPNIRRLWCSIWKVIKCYLYQIHTLEVVNHVRPRRPPLHVLFLRNASIPETWTVARMRPHRWYSKTSFEKVKSSDHKLNLTIRS